MSSEWLIYVQQAPAGTAPGGGSAAPSPFGPSFMFMMVAVIGVMYFMMIRPQQKRERERQAMLSAIAKGDVIVTTGGIIGTVVGTSDKTVVLKVSDEPVTKIEFVRSAVAQVTKPGQENAGKKN